eukprot:GGOE01003910.1.p1 GENE.GGOE01003910.1~~GGOE01003910.1.p1  ORF type:complete len:230 (-),score=41.74 GGOE01003910.1:25-714(-)
MKDRGLKPCVVTFSTYLKGLCTTGSMEGAVAVLAEMDKVGVRPNLRTVNTYLRGCLMHGTVQGGITCFTQMKDRWGLEPDASALEYVVQLLCQVLRLKEARRIIRQMGECAAVSTHSLAHAYLCVSKAAILICDRQLAEKYMQRSQTCLERGSLDPLPPSNADCDAEGGKRAWGKKTDDLAQGFPGAKERSQATLNLFSPGMFIHMCTTYWFSPQEWPTCGETPLPFFY